jgi:hypothetical protein
MKMMRKKFKPDSYDVLDEIEMDVEYGVSIVVHIMTTHPIIVHIYLSLIDNKLHIDL